MHTELVMGLDIIFVLLGGHRVKFGLGGTLCVYFVATDKAG